MGLYLDRWPARIVGVLGVLKAGGAYLPLDPDHPAERLVGMLRDSGATTLVTEQHLRGRLPGCPSLVVALDALVQSPAGIETANPEVRVCGENIAYVVYTSGSTGRPKGVLVSHRSILAAASAWQEAYDLSSSPLRHLQAAGFAFDVFTGDWVRALTTGGTLVACPRSVLLDPAALADLIRRERIECLELVPAIASALAAHLERQREDLGTIRLLAVGSDTLHGSLYRRLWRLMRPGGKVVNSYGLTEATVDSTYFTERPDDLRDADGPVPIGRPFPGTRTYVLDDRHEPAPVGVIGELYIGGPGVTRGYVANPRQTAERFVPDPHAAPGARMYATGDRARWREGGVLELLGRRDAQVKVRGFRVELGEVEAVLVQHPGVREAVVSVLKDSHGENRLVAYLVPDTLSYPTTSELRRWLHDQMPEPMVPSSYVFLEALPVSPNGKLDRSALWPPAALERDGEPSECAPPRTRAEEILAGILADLLSRSRVGIHDNFFEIGVDSILGIQMVSRARQAGLAVDPADLFRYPSIAELAGAALLNLGHQDSSVNSASAIAPFELAPEGLDLEAVDRAFADSGGIEDLYPLTPMQEGMLFHTLADPEAGHYVEQFVCRLRGELDPSALQESWNRLLTRHPALRTTIHWTDSDRPYQVVHRHVEHPIEYRDWRGLEPSEQAERLTAYLDSDRRRGFIPSQPPLSRSTIVRLGDDLHEFIWSIHHAVIDGWCLSVLLHEVLEIYESIRGGNEPGLKPVRPFRDYVAWLRDRDDAQAEGFWRQALRGVTAATPLGLERNSSHGRGPSRRQFDDRETALRGGYHGQAPGGRSVASAHAQHPDPGRLGSSPLAVQQPGRRPLRRHGFWSTARAAGRGIHRRPVHQLATAARRGDRSGFPDPMAIQDSGDHGRAAAVRGGPAFAYSNLERTAGRSAALREHRDRPEPPLRGLAARTRHRAGHRVSSLRGENSFPAHGHSPAGHRAGDQDRFRQARFEGCAIERMLGHLRTVLEAMALEPDRHVADLPLMTENEQEQLIGPWQPSHGELLLDNLHVDQFTESQLDALIDRLR